MDAVAAAEDGSRPDEADPGDHLRGNPVRCSARPRQLDRHHREERRTDGDQHVRAEAGGLLPVLAFEADRRAEPGCQEQPQRQVNGWHVACGRNLAAGRSSRKESSCSGR